MTVFACRVLAARAFAIYDDAFITYRYAQNLASGLGMVFNPGAAWEPVMGTTTPGYSVLLAGLSLTGLDMIQVSLALNFVCDAAIAWLLITLFDRRLVASMVSVLAFAAIPEIARISVGGMEPPVMVMMALASVACLGRARPVCSGVAAAFACTLRPECVLLLPIVGWCWLRRSRRELVRFVVPVAVIGITTVAVLTWVYGSPIAHSITAKAAHDPVSARLGRVSDILAQAFGPSVPMRLMFVPAAIGAIVCLVRRSKFLPFALFATAVVAAYVIARPKTWGWYFYAPLVAWVGWFGLGVDQMAQWFGEARLGLASGRRQRAAVRVLPLLIIAGVSLFPVVHPDHVTPKIYERIEAWAKEARIEERQATILASDIGAFGYYAGGVILDSEGLVWPPALEGERMDQAQLAVKHRPDYVVVVSRQKRLRAFRENPEASRLYVPIRRFNRIHNGTERLVPELTSLPKWWEQDYLIYALRDPDSSEAGTGGAELVGDSTPDDI